MKKILISIISIISLLILASFIFDGCSKSYLLDVPEKTQYTDTTGYISYSKYQEYWENQRENSPQEDTVEISDVPIDFNVTVEDWKE